LRPPVASDCESFACSRASYFRVDFLTVTSQTKFGVGLVQMAVSPQPKENLARAGSKIEEAARNGAQVVCLPELFQSQYFCQREDTANFDLAEAIPGPTTEALGRVALNAKVVVVAPLFERRAAGVYHNTAAIICWDQWYPEGARLAALNGACILFYPTAIGWHPSEKESNGAAQRDSWRTVQRGHAIANGIYVAAVNRVGHELPAAGGDGLEFWGGSFLCDPQGVILAEASTDREEILYGTIDLAHLEDVRRNWPFLRDRRIDAYKGIEQRFLDEKP
jgi:N-carbamoylputrescine amidase